VSGYYWNRDNFKGLAALSSAFRADSRLERLADYCDLREKGLRRQAFAQLDAFLKEAASWETPVQRELAVRVLEAHWNTQDAHQFLAEPLRKRILHVLEEWRAADAHDPVPARYLALLHYDRSLMAEALRMNPKDGLVRVKLAKNLLSLVEYATHHLAEGKFIGDENEVSATLAEAASIVAGVEDASAKRELDKEVEELTALLSDWREYQLAPEGTFPEWCRARNRPHRWWSMHYYS
jgi:hypothetical protein